MRKDGLIGLAMFIFLSGVSGNDFFSLSVPVVRGSDPWSEQAGLLKNQFYCNFQTPHGPIGSFAAGTADLSIVFNQNVQDIVNTDMIILNPEPANRPISTYYLTNANTTDFTNFTWSFHAIWKGDIDYGPPIRSSTPVPQGRCNLIKGSSVTASASTSQASASPSASCSVSTLVYSGTGIGVFLMVLVTATVSVNVN